MPRRHLFLATTFALGLAAMAPAAGSVPAAPPLAAEASRLTLPPPKPGHAKPLVVILADNAATETTDFTIPYGVLKESGVAEVVSVSTHPGPVKMLMALTILADQTVAQFDAAHPEGADLVVVPYLAKPDKPALSAWLKAQYARGATVMSICAGAQNLAEAGLLEGKRATTHWNFMDKLRKGYPTTTWVRDRRYVQDGRIITTTGVSASMPASLALVEAIGGRALAEQTAQRLGASGWSAAHRSADFPFDTGEYAEAGLNIAAPWRHERMETPVRDGFDEIGLALTADAWTSTFRTTVAATSPTAAPVRSRHGLLLVPDARPGAHPALMPTHAAPSLAQLDLALADIGVHYGAADMHIAAKGLEYPQR